MMGVLLFLGVLRLRRNLSPAKFRVLFGAQLIGNLALLAARGFVIGAPFG
jgi:hypothetical protein